MLQHHVRGRACVLAALIITIFGALAAPSAIGAQNVAPSQEMRDRGHRMLAQLRDDLHSAYYDSTYHGLDMEGKLYHAADSAIDAAANNNFIMGALAQYLSNLQDSHTVFIAPGHQAKVDYGFSWQIFGDSAFVTRVKKDSDAEKKGLKRGDAIVGIDLFRVNRDGWRVLRYVYYSLSPRAGLHLVVKSPGDNATHTLDITSTIKMGERVIDLENVETIRRLIEQDEREQTAVHHYKDVAGDSVLYWQMNEFVYGDQDNVDKMIDMARTHRAVVFDLRGNGGGSVDIQRYIIGRFVSQDLNYGMMKGRRKTDSLVAHAAKDPLKSMLVILIDGGSASSSEMTAYALQAQGRAIVVGDRSMGAVMTANIRGHEVGGVERKMPYQMEITIADVVMADGTRLENRGVTPDELVVPTSADLAAKRDPALARALAIAGVTRTPEDAWRIVHGGGDSKDR